MEDNVQNISLVENNNLLISKHSSRRSIRIYCYVMIKANLPITLLVMCYRVVFSLISKHSSLTKRRKSRCNRPGVLTTSRPTFSSGVTMATMAAQFHVSLWSPERVKRRLPVVCDDDVNTSRLPAPGPPYIEYKNLMQTRPLYPRTGVYKLFDR